MTEGSSSVERINGEAPKILQARSQKFSDAAARGTLPQMG